MTVDSDIINNLIYEGPFLLMLVTAICSSVNAGTGWALINNNQVRSALAFGFAALVTARHFEFTLAQQYGIVLGVYFGVEYALPPPPPSQDVKPSKK
jgi:hypothetical protein